MGDQSKLLQKRKAKSKWGLLKSCFRKPDRQPRLPPNPTPPDAEALSQPQFSSREEEEPIPEEIREEKKEELHPEWPKMDERLEKILEEESMRLLDCEFNKLTPMQRKCLLSFSVYEPNSKIKKQIMIYWWIGEGFAEPSGNITAEENGEEIFRRLAELGFIEPIGNSCTSTIHECRVQPFVHWMVKKKAREASFCDLDERGKPSAEQSKSPRLCLTSETKPSSFSSVSKKLTMFNVSKQSYRSQFNEFLINFKSLVVLQLGRWSSNAKYDIEVEGFENFKNIGLLTNLRYLGLQGLSTLTTLPPEIKNLKHLLILDLRGCQYLEKVGKDVTYLKRLTRLDLTECYMLEHIDRRLGSLSELQVFKGFVFGRSTDRSRCRLADLSKLTKLRKLSINITSEAKIDNVVDEMNVLSNFQSVQSLTIIWGEIPTIGDLETNSIREKWKALKLPPRIKKFNMRCFPFAKMPNWLAGAQNLKRLYIKGGKLQTLHPENGSNETAILYPSIERMCLKNLVDFGMEWAKIREMMPNLDRLEFVKCEKLMSPPPLDQNHVWIRDKIDEEEEESNHVPPVAPAPSPTNPDIASTSTAVPSRIFKDFQGSPTKEASTEAIGAPKENITRETAPNETAMGDDATEAAAAAAASDEEITTEPGKGTSPDIDSTSTAVPSRIFKDLQGSPTKEASTEQQVIGSPDRSSFGNEHQEDYEWTCSYVDESMLYGDKDEAKKKIVEELIKNDDFNAVGIVGSYGCGKTNLARWVFIDEKVKDEFPLRLWVCVGPDCEKQNLLYRMLDNLGLETDEVVDIFNNSKVVQESNDKVSAKIGVLLFILHQQLSDVKYLIVFDDVRCPTGPNEWYRNLGSKPPMNKVWDDRLGYGLPKGNGSAVIVTCRKEEDARTMVGTGLIYSPERLGEKEGWDLFRRAFYEAKKNSDHVEEGLEKKSEEGLEEKLEGLEEKPEEGLEEKPEEGLKEKLEGREEKSEKGLEEKLEGFEEKSEERLEEKSEELEKKSEEGLEEKLEGLEEKSEEELEEKLEGLEEKPEEGLEEKLVGFEEKLEGFEEKSEEGLEEKLEGLEEKPEEGLEEKLERLEEKSEEGLEEKLEGLEEKPEEGLEEKLEGLEEESEEGLEEKLEGLEEESEEELEEESEEEESESQKELEEKSEEEKKLERLEKKLETMKKEIVNKCLGFPAALIAAGRGLATLLLD